MAKRDDAPKKKVTPVDQKQGQDGVILGYLDSLLKEVDEASNDTLGAVDPTTIDDPSASSNTIDSDAAATTLDLSHEHALQNQPEVIVDSGATKSQPAESQPTYEAHVDSLDELGGDQNNQHQQRTRVDQDSALDFDSSAVDNAHVDTAEKENDSIVAPAEVGRSRAVAFSDLSVDEWQQLNLSKLDWHENGRPIWAQSRFECLLFEVGGLLMAAPLVELGCIVRVNQKFTHIVGSPPWTLGIFQHANVSYRCVDTALVLMGSRYQSSYKEDLEFLITINDSLWGLACQKIQKSVTLEPDKVRWRKSSGVKKWFAGTAVDHMCTVVDVEALAAQLDFNAKIR